jgi:hypothetical protein
LGDGQEQNSGKAPVIVGPALAGQSRIKYSRNHRRNPDYGAAPAQAGRHRAAVQRDYDRRLSRLTVYWGQLNEVWTSLINNVTDATDSRGDIIAMTYRAMLPHCA